MYKPLPKDFPAYIRSRISEGIDNFLDSNKESISAYDLTRDEAREIMLSLVAAEAFNLLHALHRSKLKK